eukprot:1394797-Amorphochlora_amoeboformis.AAC.2
MDSKAFDVSTRELGGPLDDEFWPARLHICQEGGIPGLNWAIYAWLGTCHAPNAKRVKTRWRALEYTGTPPNTGPQTS